MVSPSSVGASTGNGFMPFLKQCSTYLKKRLGHFSREGMKPSPAQGACDPCLDMYAEESFIDTISIDYK